jgi:Zn ribbon nucleic-acid-binding protein
MNFTPSDTDNYNTATQNVNIMVNPKNISGAAVNITGTYTYNGEAQSPTAGNVSITLSGFTPTYTHAVTAGGTNAGPATVTATGTGNFTGTATGTFTILPAPLTLTADDKIITVGAAEPAYTFTVSGLIAPDTADVVNKPPTMSVTGFSSAAAATFPISIIDGETDNTNYTIATRTNGTLTVSVKTDMSASITFTPGSKAYTGTELECDPATGLTGGTWTYSYTAVTGTLGSGGKPLEAGTYTATAKFEDATRIGTATGTFTVTKANGAAVGAPAIDGTPTENSITISAVTAPANGQAVEYAIGTSPTAPATGWQTGLAFGGLDEYTQYYIFARSAENANYGAGAASTGTAAYTADVTPPTGEIAVKTNKFNAFLNGVLFGLFFKDTVNVAVTGNDGGSGVKTVEYIKSETVYTEAEAKALTGWTAIANGGSFNVPADFKGYIYARITDNAGNVAVLASDGIMVYTGSTAATTSVGYTKGSGEDKTASVNLNGNTINRLEIGTYMLDYGTDYTVSGGMITLSAAYLESLAAGSYTLTVYYNPMDEAYLPVPGGDSDPQPSTAIALTIVPAGHTHSFGTVWVKDATGHWHECVCGAKSGFAAHTMGSWITDTPATETTDGTKHRECAVCGYIETGTIPATGAGHTHTPGTAWLKDATGHWHECSCGVKSDFAAHTPGAWIVDTPATKTTEGSRHKECTACGYTTDTETIPATGSCVKYVRLFHWKTKYISNFWNWFKFILLFGWIWMWF